MTSRAGRKIHPFRTSGVNPRPQALQPSYEPGEVPQGHTVSYPPQRPSTRAQAHLAAAADTHLIDPPRVPASAPTTAVFIDGAKVSIPSNWMLAFSTSGNKDTIYAVEPSGALHVLTLNGAGELRELAGLSAELIDDLLRWRFPKVRR